MIGIPNRAPQHSIRENRICNRAPRMTRPTLSGISPFFIVADVPAALSFYRDMLGFEVTFRGPTPEDEFFGIVLSDEACDSFHIYWDKRGKRFVWTRN